jgi:hypothetical protein
MHVTIQQLFVLYACMLDIDRAYAYKLLRVVTPSKSNKIFHAIAL